LIHNDAQRFRLEVNPAMQEDAYNVVHASTTYNSANEQWALTFGIRNATNEIYSTAGSFSTTGIGTAAVNVSRPREAYLRYQYWVGGR
ncbi:MAG: TonB-dependent receptor, partial [Rhodospirillaceae bacterium]|nr:TonB-dependent receptor [Rhodospirillaceae bacterium]